MEQENFSMNQRMPELPYDYPPLTHDPLEKQTRARPGCVSAYVVFMIFSALIAFCGGTGFVLLPSYQKTSLAQTYEEQAQRHYEYKGKVYVGSGNDIMQNVFKIHTGITLRTFGILVIVFGVVTAFASLGLWRMRKWGLILYFIALFISLGLNTLIINLVANIPSVWIGVMGGITVWFYHNRWRFT